MPRITPAGKIERDYRPRQQTCQDAEHGHETERLAENEQRGHAARLDRDRYRNDQGSNPENLGKKRMIVLAVPIDATTENRTGAGRRDNCLLQNHRSSRTHNASGKPRYNQDVLSAST